jgi:hypothetical protein
MPKTFFFANGPTTLKNSKKSFNTEFKRNKVAESCGALKNLGKFLLG